MHPCLTHRDYLIQSKNPEPTTERIPFEFAFLRGLAKAFLRDWRRRRMTAVLRAMDDRLLDDIGIDRRDIGRIVDSLDDRKLGMPSVAPSRPVSSLDTGVGRFPA